MQCADARLVVGGGREVSESLSPNSVRGQVHLERGQLAGTESRREVAQLRQPIGDCRCASAASCATESCTATERRCATNVSHVRADHVVSSYSDEVLVTCLDQL